MPISHKPAPLQKYKLDVKNNDESETLYVTSRDISLVPSGQANVPEVLPVHSSPENEILLCKLGPNQRLKFTAQAMKGIGKEHSKWTPVGVATFAQQPVVRIDQEDMSTLTTEQKRAFVASCPTKVYRYDETNDTVEVEEERACMFCRECIIEAEKMDHEDLVSIEIDEETFIFSVESTGQLTAADIVQKAIRALREKMILMENAVSDLKKGGQQAI